MWAAVALLPAAKEAVKLARKIPTLGVGVHLNLSEGRALSQKACVGCLLDSQGRFAYSALKLSVLSVAGHSIRNAIRAELCAQIQWVIDNGVVPTHLDSHKHIHCFPAIFPIVCELARKFGITAVRWTFEPEQLSAMPWPLPGEGGRKRTRLMRIMANINRMQNKCFLKTDALLGIAHMGKIDINFFKAVTLYNRAAVAEVMTHPRLSDGTETSDAGTAYQQKTELDALCSERTRQYFEEAGIKLVHYGQL